jgi:hypothetical protein
VDRIRQCRLGSDTRSFIHRAPLVVALSIELLPGLIAHSFRATGGGALAMSPAWIGFWQGRPGTNPRSFIDCAPLPMARRPIVAAR